MAMGLGQVRALAAGLAETEDRRRRVAMAGIRMAVWGDAEDWAEAMQDATAEPVDEVAAALAAFGLIEG